MPSKDEITLAEGWQWDNDWTVDMNRGCDDEGMVGFLSSITIFVNHTHVF